MSSAGTAPSDGDLAERVEVGAEHLRIGPTSGEGQEVRVERQDSLKSETDVAGADKLQQLGRRPLRGGPACDQRHVDLTAKSAAGER